MRSANESSSRERKRAKSAAVIVQAGTDWSIASCTVQRPSPESSTHPRIFASFGSSCERPAGQLDEPRAHDAALHPEVGDPGEVQAVRALVHQREALGDGLHHAVLDPVVDHLHVVAGAVGAHVSVAVLGRERAEEGLEVAEDGLLAAHHEAVADLEPPDAPAGPDVHVVEAERLERLGAPRRRRGSSCCRRR